MQIDLILSQLALYDTVLTIQAIVLSDTEPWQSVVALGASGIEWLWLLILVIAHLWISWGSVGTGSLSMRLRIFRKLGVEIAGVMGVLFLTYIGKYLFTVTRPYEVFGLDQSHPLLNSQASFPSAHSALFVYVTCIVLSGVRSDIARFIGLVALAVVIFARVGAGYHYVSDVVVGSLIGVIIYEIVMRISGSRKNGV